MSRELAFAGALVATLLAGRAASAQACCAGSGALTPARLAPHDDALVGAQVRAASVIGSYDADSAYVPTPKTASEADYEQDSFGAVRVAPRAQLALLVPVVETHRAGLATSGPIAETGGGLGDVNASARYDFFLAGQSRVWPGVAALAGVTAPTGRSVEQARKPLATDGTGIGAWQLQLGVALEQTAGAWTLGASAIAAQRTARTVPGAGAAPDASETLGLLFTGTLSAGYTLRSDASFALAVSYAVERDAAIGGKTEAGSGHRVLLASLAALVPLADAWRVQGSLFANPPAASFGRNWPATAGVTLGLVRTFS